MTLVAVGYVLKKDLKAAVGEKLRYKEVSLFGPEYKSTGTFSVVGPGEYVRKWFASVTTHNDLIIKVE